MFSKEWVAALAFFLCAVLFFNPLLANNSIIPDSASGRDELTNSLDRGRIGIATGGAGGTYIKLGADLARLVSSEGDALRVVVQLGAGSIGNLRDLAFLKYVDLALVQADVLKHIEKTDENAYNYLKQRIGYVARFHPEVVHILAKGGPFSSVNELDGKRIAIGLPGSGTQITAPLVFEELGLRDVKFIDMYQREALEDLARPNSKIDGLVYVAGRGSSIFRDLSSRVAAAIDSEDIYFVPVPFTPSGDSSYEVVELTSDDYPAFVAEGDALRVWAVPAVLAAYNWGKNQSAVAKDRNRRMKAFIDAFFSNSERLGEGAFNDNWCFIDLGKTVPGWDRISGATDWLDNPRNTSGWSSAICNANQSVLGPVQYCAEFVEQLREFGMATSNPNAPQMYEKWKSSNPGKC